jgi:hypothetical protein
MTVRMDSLFGYRFAFLHYRLDFGQQRGCRSGVTGHEIGGKELAMPIGQCKLCLQQKEVRDSHLLPAALYRKTRNPRSENPNPVLVTPDVAIQTSEQIKDYLLCGDCEQRFNVKGEQWVMRQVCVEREFGLLDKLREIPPEQSCEGLELYSAAQRPAIDITSLGYFALSVLWRAGVHNWRVLNANTAEVTLGPYREVLRRYLYGTDPFPENVVVWVTACTDFYSQGAFFEPALTIMKEPVPYTCYGFLIRGIFFNVYLGNRIPVTVKRLCCVTSPEKWILVRSMENETVRAYARLDETAKPVGNLTRVTPGGHDTLRA